MKPEMEEKLLKAINNLSKQVSQLGLNDAVTPHGAIELLWMEMKKCRESIEKGLAEIAEAIRDYE